MSTILDLDKTRMTERRKKRIRESVEMFLSGSTMTSIATHFGVTTEMTRLDLEAVGVSYETKRIKRIDAVEKLVAEGLSVHEVAAQVGVSADKVRTIARSNDFKFAAPKLLKDTHGQLQCYRNGCRCDPCKGAQRIQDAKHRK